MHRHPYGYGYGWSPWPMVVLMVLFLAGLVVLGVLLARWAVRSGRQQSQPTAPYAAGPPPGPDPERLLAERFARGEIDETEYRGRLAVLRGDTGPRPG